MRTGNLDVYRNCCTGILKCVFEKKKRTSSKASSSVSWLGFVKSSFHLCRFSAMIGSSAAQTYVHVLNIFFVCIWVCVRAYICTHMNMYICIYMYTHTLSWVICCPDLYICMNIHICVCACIYICMYVYMYMYTCIYICIQWLGRLQPRPTNMYTHVYIHIRVCIHVYIYMYTYIYVHIYINMYTHSLVFMHAHTYTLIYAFAHPCICSLLHDKHPRQTKKRTLSMRSCCSLPLSVDQCASCFSSISSIRSNMRRFALPIGPPPGFTGGSGIKKGFICKTKYKKAWRRCLNAQKTQIHTHTYAHTHT